MTCARRRQHELDVSRAPSIERALLEAAVWRAERSSSCSRFFSQLKGNERSPS